MKRREFSKVIITCSGIFVSILLVLIIVLICVFPTTANNLVTIGLALITAIVSILSWYFGKAYGENKLKISSGIDSVFDTIKTISKNGDTIVEETATTKVKEDSSSDNG